MMIIRRPPIAALLIVSVVLAACRTSSDDAARPAAAPPPTSSAESDDALLNDIQHRTFLWFWETANPKNGLVPDRWPTRSASSIVSKSGTTSARVAAG